MSNLITKCPVCGHESLEFSQTADIGYDVIDGKLVPRLDEDSVGFLDSTYLYCRNCGANDADDRQLADIKFEYDHHV
jgi:hypothetical protein